ncbi:hypothetical protein [Phenylobacterium immobile]|uniref:hypothetical protein n=1 Tax=Phenylobacterium immobile TaxID=21 RepID=UPI000AF2D938|nr:hypothetical protein [Phenylobacterium immobile]
MTAPYKDWTVQPHGPLDPIGEDMLTVVGTIRMPLGEFPRRMTIVRLGDGRLIIYSAIALEEEQMAELEAFGTPTFLVVPSERHRLDAPAFKDRYPDLFVLAPSGARATVGEVVPVDAETADFGDSVKWVEVPGTNGTEAALEVKSSDGLTLVVNEIVGAIHHAGGVRGWLLRLMGFAGDEPHVPAPVKVAFSKGRADLAAQMVAWAERPDLKRIVMSHGDIIAEDPAGVLRKLAIELS